MWKERNNNVVFYHQKSNLPSFVTQNLLYHMTWHFHTNILTLSAAKFCLNLSLQSLAAAIFCTLATNQTEESLEFQKAHISTDFSTMVCRIGELSYVYLPKWLSEYCLQLKWHFVALDTLADKLEIEIWIWIQTMRHSVNLSIHKKQKSWNSQKRVYIFTKLVIISKSLMCFGVSSTSSVKVI